MTSQVSTTRPEAVTSGRALVGYELAVAAMQRKVAAIREGRCGEQIWLLEHPPLYTAGTSAKPEDLTAPTRFPTFAAGRGGQWTYHGPGQRVAYVLLDLTRPHGSVPPRDVRAYVAGLERWLIDTLKRLGITGEQRPGRVGIWVDDRDGGAAGESKIAAIGVRVTRWVSWHGISLNVDPVLDHFDGIVPCGLRGHGVTSLRACGNSATIQEVDAALLASWPAIFGNLPGLRASSDQAESSVG